MEKKKKNKKEKEKKEHDCNQSYVASMLYVNKPNWCTNKLSQEKRKVGPFDQHDTASTKFQSFHVLRDEKDIYICICVCVCVRNFQRLVGNMTRC